MNDQYTDEDGNDITCRNCSVTAREFFEYIFIGEPPKCWMVGPNWYCSNECYEEATRNEG